MKTKIIFAAAAILFSINVSMANQSESMLTFWNVRGEKLVQPILAEEETETIPLKIQCAYKNAGSSHISSMFNLSDLSKPEEEEALPYYISAD